MIRVFRACCLGVVWLLGSSAGLGAEVGPGPARVLRDIAYLGPGRPETLDVYIPARAKLDPPSPAIVWIHGGGWTSGDKAEERARAVGQALADAGYVCASIDYRLGPGAWPTNLLDCKNAVRFLRQHGADYAVDPDRIAVMGASAGGHLALLTALTTADPALEPTAPYPGISDAVSAVVDLGGIAEPRTWHPGSDPEFTSGGMAAMLGRDLSTDPARWQAASALDHVRSDSPPVFIAQGMDDTVVDPAQARDLDRALREHGVAHQLLLLPGVGRILDLTAGPGHPLAPDLRADVLAFLQQYLGIAAHGLPVEPDIPGPRVQVDLDPGWRFENRDDPQGAETLLDDSGWTAVDLPHTWNALDGEDGGANYRRGPAWYRRHLTVDPMLAGKRLYLQFDGACFQADVYVNGKHLGSHLGGFARFRFDATDALQVGQDNLIAVRVDNGALGLIPLRADFTFFGGLYRPVSLIATEPVQISMMDYGSPGVFITQDKVTPARADLNIRAEIENYEDKGRKVEVETAVLDAAGRPAGTAESKFRLAAGDAVAIVQNISIAEPHLWDGRADPYLYRVRVTVLTDGKVRDRQIQPVGLRFFRVDPDHGFFLNGRYLDLHGVNRHQDRLDEGWAISPADEAEDFALVRELGCTALRMSHYQHSETWYERCDRAGIVVWAEVPFVGEALDTPAFLDNAKDQLRELIRQNYNHPAICFWSVGNETHGKPAQHVVAELASLAKAEDATRLSTYASDTAPADPRNWYTDIVGFNYYAGWYRDEVTALPAYLDSLRAQHPGRAVGLSEFGAGASIYEHALPPVHPAPGGRFHPEEYQTYFHEAYWAALAARSYLWGKFVWCLFDFASDGRHEGDHPGRNDKGLVTYDRRTRKDAYYFYKANWSSEPVVYLASGRFIVRRKAETEVNVLSNAPEVELWLNGRSLGVERSPDHVFRWPGVTLRPGDNLAAAVGHFGPLTMTDGCTWTYRPISPPPAK